MLWAYEIDMIRNDSGASLIPFIPERLHPCVHRLAQQIGDTLAHPESEASIESMTFERRMPERSRELVLRQLSRDLDLIQDDSILGNSDKMLFHTKELVASIEDPKLTQNPFVMTKLDL